MAVLTLIPHTAVPKYCLSAKYCSSPSKSELSVEKEVTHPQPPGSGNNEVFWQAHLELAISPAHSQASRKLE